jgi:hypothetical protein
MAEVGNKTNINSVKKASGERDIDKAFADPSE